MREGTNTPALNGQVHRTGSGRVLTHCHHIFWSPRLFYVFFFFREYTEQAHKHTDIQDAMGVTKYEEPTLLSELWWWLLLHFRRHPGDVPLIRPGGVLLLVSVRPIAEFPIFPPKIPISLIVSIHSIKLFDQESSRRVQAINNNYRHAKPLLNIFTSTLQDHRGCPQSAEMFNIEYCCMQTTIPITKMHAQKYTRHISNHVYYISYVW